MVQVDVANLSLDFPILEPSARQLKSQVARSLGGLWHKQRGQPPFIRALDNVTFRLAAGDRLGVMGRNGAGKTTLLRVLSRIYEPSTGTVRTQGTLTSFLDLTAGLDINATGNENIALRASLVGWDQSSLVEAFGYVERISGLGNFLDLPLRTYSAGMLMRLAFGLATARTTDILVMDEWLAVGDSDHQRLAERRIAELVDKAGILILASHARGMIESWCTHLLILDAGKVAFFGRVEDGLAQAVS